MAFSIVNLGSSFYSTGSSLQLKPCFTFMKPSCTGLKVVDACTRLGCSSSDDAASLRARLENVSSDRNVIVRRSGNYPPSMWNYDTLQSLTSNFKGEIFRKHACDLKENVRMLLKKKDTDSLGKLELIDLIQRLGVGYHFEDEIRSILEAICNNDEKWDCEDLYAASLKFRLLRQHNFNVPQEVFKDFRPESGNFKASLRKDLKGMLYLYEASHLSTRGEKIMDEARDFTEKNLKDYINNSNNSIDEKLGKLVSHALELPLHWREERHEARWFIDFYDTLANINDNHLLDFAKYDYNMVQSIYQDDLKHMSSWWKRIELGEKLSFARDRVMECFCWGMGFNSRPEFGYGRRVLAAVTALITTIDDIYDVYASLEELELLTKITKRWNYAELDQLPEYMKVCFTALYDEINEVANVAERKHGVDILPYLQKVWTDLFEVYMVEAQWYHSGYKPSLSEYLENAWTSVGSPVILTHSYFLTTNAITDEALQCLMSGPKIIRLAATICRLADDMGTSSHEIERGDNPKAIQCHVSDNGVSEEEAREQIQYIISDTLKELNEERQVALSHFPKPFVDMCVNLAKISLTTYLHGDGHGVPTSLDKERLSNLFVKPIPL